MKYLIVFAILFVGLWLWRGNRRPPAGDAPRPQPQPRLQDMVSCAVCGLHVPLADATPGRKGGVYCGIEHRQRAEG